jgi:hypothetical protein
MFANFYFSINKLQIYDIFLNKLYVMQKKFTVLKKTLPLRPEKKRKTFREEVVFSTFSEKKCYTKFV